jgi:hypothetical protein
MGSLNCGDLGPAHLSDYEGDRQGDAGLDSAQPLCPQEGNEIIPSGVMPMIEVVCDHEGAVEVDGKIVSPRGCGFVRG